MNKTLIFLALILTCSIASGQTLQYNYNLPNDNDDGIKTGSLESVQISQSGISEMVEAIKRNEYENVHSILLYKDGSLVLEEYFPGHRFDYMADKHLGEIVNWSSDTLHRVMSVTKSITSICVGIAIQQGFIESADQSIFDYLPGYKEYAADGKEDIKIKHLLTMTSGLNGNEWLVPYANPENAIIQVYNSKEPIEKILSLELRFKPGEAFQYFGGSNFLLGEIVRNASGMDMTQLAEKYLFGPLGIKKYEWIRANKGVVDGAGGLLISPRAMLKIGMLFLNNGNWNGEQIVSEDWVRKSSKSFGSNKWMNRWDDHWGMRGYSYSWWTHTLVHNDKRFEMYYAAGWGGQYIMVIPDLQTVAVFTGANYTTYRPPFDLLKKYILTSYPGSE